MPTDEQISDFFPFVLDGMVWGIALSFVMHGVGLTLRTLVAFVRGT